MNQQQTNNSELTPLIQGYCDGSLDAAGEEQLHALLLGDPNAQLLFLEQLDLHAQLQWQFGAGLTNASESHAETAILTAAHSATKRQAEPGSPQSIHQLLFHPRSWATALTLLVAVAMAFVWINQSDTLQQAQNSSPLRRYQHGSPTVIAQVTQCLAASWGDSDRTLQVGDEIPAGRLSLRQGIAEITFVNGARILLEAPTELEITDPLHVFLLSGRAVANTPATAVGFTIETQRSRVVDLGTEFGLLTGPQGEMLVQVFDGVVLAEVKGEQGTLQRLTAGQTRSLDEHGDTLNEQPFVADRFIRRLPTPNRRQGPTPPYNESQHGSVQICPVQPQVIVDGDPSEWENQGRFHSECRPPYDKSYCMWGQMAYDERFLYLAAHVADPSPLRNRLDPISEPRFFWAGGSVVVRLCTDRNMVYPLEGLHESGKSPREFREESSNQLVNVAMWHSQKDDQSHLTLRYGMDFRDAKTDPTGWRGGFRRDKNGRGYVLEYAIPWSSLNAGENPPLAGDELAAVWHIHWSDEQGRSCFGQLIEVTNPNELPYSFLNPRCWGKAIYQAK